MKPAVLYLRVSTIEQTTANQERELRDIAARIGCDIVKGAPRVRPGHGLERRPPGPQPPGPRGRFSAPAIGAGGPP